MPEPIVRTSRRSPWATRRPRAFSLIDLLVSISVIALLIGLMSPVLSKVNEAARRVVCGSNLRQIGLAASMWDDDHYAAIPPTSFAQDEQARRNSTNLHTVHRGDTPNQWEGLGFLVSEGYLNSHLVFYCPSHHGPHTAEEYAESWAMLDQRIVCNFAYRGASQTFDFGETLSDESVIASDGFLGAGSLNHGDGGNTLAADLSVSWTSDDGGRIASLVGGSSNRGTIDIDNFWGALEGSETESEGAESPRVNFFEQR